jgi:hypothetical protein
MLRPAAQYPFKFGQLINAAAALPPLLLPPLDHANCCCAVFLAVFKWEARKGWKDLIQGFTAAFKPTDPAVLWILARPFMESGTVSWMLQDARDPMKFGSWCGCSGVDYGTAFHGERQGTKCWNYAP